MQNCKDTFLELCLQNRLKRKNKRGNRLFRYFFLHRNKKSFCDENKDSPILSEPQHSFIDQFRTSMKFLVQIDVKQRKI